MAFALDPRLPLGQGLQRIVVERLDDALAALASVVGADPDAVEKHLHDARKRCKQARAAARLVRGLLGSRYRTFNQLVGDGARELGELRDAHALSATVAGLAETAPEQFAGLRAELADLAARAHASAAAGDPRVDRAQSLLSAAREEALAWDLGDGFAVIEPGLRHTYRAARRAWRASRSDPSDEQLHAWRRQTKYLWHQLRLVAPADPERFAPLVRRLDRIADALGDDHDLALVIDRIEHDPQLFGGAQGAAAAVRLAGRRRRRLRKRAKKAGAKVFGRRPKRFTRRVRRAWNAATHS